MSTCVVFTGPFPCTICGESVEPGEWEEHLAMEHYFLLGESFE